VTLLDQNASFVYKVSSAMGRDDSWPAAAPSVVPSSRTVYRRKRSGNAQNGGTVLPIANTMADSESGSPDSYSSFLVTIRLSRLVSEIFTCDKHTDGRTNGRTKADHYYYWPPLCGGPANKRTLNRDCLKHLLLC